MDFKCLEITYDIDVIPEVSTRVARPGLPRWDEAAHALAFRAQAIEKIEAALVAADLGEWEDAGIGCGRVTIGFAVDDFDAAETVLRRAVAGTPFAAIREITRCPGHGGNVVH